MPPPPTRVRHYTKRASYEFPAAREIFRLQPVAHVAFVHPGDALTDGAADGDTGPYGRLRGESVMNVPLITVILPEGGEEDAVDGEDEGGWSVFFHTGLHGPTLTDPSQTRFFRIGGSCPTGMSHGDGDNDYQWTNDSKPQAPIPNQVSGSPNPFTAVGFCGRADQLPVDGLVLSPAAHDHSLNYRSATLHLTDPRILPNSTSHDEKTRALTAVTNTLLHYPRTGTVGIPHKAAVDRTTVVKCKIAGVSCKQRHGGWRAGQEPEVIAPEGSLNGQGEGWKGVVPCWTQWGDLIGYGSDGPELGEVFEERSERGKEFGMKSAWASEDGVIEGLGRKKA